MHHFEYCARTANIHHYFYEMFLEFSHTKHPITKSTAQNINSVYDRAEKLKEENPSTILFLKKLSKKIVLKSKKMIFFQCIYSICRHMSVKNYKN